MLALLISASEGENMPQNPTGADAAKSLTDIPKNAYHALTSAFGLDDDGDDPKKKKPVTPPGPTMVDEANQSFRDSAAADAAKSAPKPAGFMAKAMAAKRPAPAPAPATSAARNRYGSLNKKTRY
jgi:hypothetical protein